MLVITVLICGAVLFVAIAALFTFQVLNFRSNFQRDTTALAVIIANNSSAPLSFGADDKAGNEVLAALQAKPSVLDASLVLPNGNLFASYGAPENERARSQFPPPRQQRFVAGQLLVTEPVILKRERIGTLYLRADYRRTFLQLLGPASVMMVFSFKWG